MEQSRKLRKIYCGRTTLLLDRPAVMGVVNLTPDSFSGDGLGGNLSAAIRHAEAQIAAGADIVDIGAESSRPGARPLTLENELARLMPVLHALRDCPVPISVDTYKPEVMRAAIDAGASVINDIYGFRCPEALEAVKGGGCAVCIMHMQGAPRDMQASPFYEDVVEEVVSFLHLRVSAANSAGIVSERCWIDPGFGFGKTLEHNIALFRALGRMASTGYPVLVGVSRKSMLGALTGRPVNQLLPASVVAAAMAARSGVAIIRVHDVAATLDGIKVGMALTSGE